MNGIFGPATTRAVKMFQKKYGIAQVGTVGPQTRAKLNEVFASSMQALTPPASASSQASAVSAVLAGIPSRTLNPGERNDQVKLLQQLLAGDKSIYPEGTASGFFGPATVRAIQKFQLKHDLIKSTTDVGSGRFGPKTKAKFEEVFGQSPVSGSTANTSGSSVSASDAKVIRDQITDLQSKLIQEQIKAIQEKINALKK